MMNYNGFDAIQKCNNTLIIPRYGFNGMEKDREYCSCEDDYTSFYRAYDSRIARWKSIDPKLKLFPELTPYNNNLNSPIIYKDPKGDCPICILFIALALTPTPLAAPTGNYESDATAMKDALNTQGKWLLTVLAGSAVSTGVVSTSAVLKQASGQFVLNTVVNFNLGKTKNDLGASMAEALLNVDFADAVVSQLSIGKIMQNVLGSWIDITPEEIKALGLNKDPKDITIDMVVKALQDGASSKSPKGAYAKLAKKLKDASFKAIKKEIKDEINEMTPDQDILGIKAGTAVAPPDQTAVVNIKPILEIEELKKLIKIGDVNPNYSPPTLSPAPR